jgi:hypothetical protein
VRVSWYPDILNWFNGLFPGYFWHGLIRVYLTFDDGPTPEVTDFVLNESRTTILRRPSFFNGGLCATIS